MSEEVAIKVENLSKIFKLPHEKHSSVKSLFVNFYRRRFYERLQALNDISFEIKKGEFFGIVGRNGSGKSTLLKLLAGIYSPTSGNIQVNGKLTPFIELGVGFNPELTGRENVYLNGALLGFTRKEMRSMYKDIVEFAELEKFMDQKLKNYSSGMQVRLAFSIAIRAKSDILLIDEVLAVGDAAFQQKCYDYFRTLKASKRTVVFVSHDHSALENFCNRCLLIDDGKLITLGETPNVLQKYNVITLEKMSENLGVESSAASRWGARDIEIISAVILNKRAGKFLPNETIKLEVTMSARKDVEKPVFGIVIKNQNGEQVLATNTKAERISTGRVNKKDRISVRYEIQNIFGNGKYSISPAVANEDATAFFDWREGLTSFTVSGWDDTYSSIHPPHTISIKKEPE
ncbi:MAG: ABC transporter ATP-binding protein [Candidatus Saccharimonadales bacterium]